MNYRLLLSAFLLLLTVYNFAYCQQVFWANKVLGYSSEYRPPQYGHAFRAKQILGIPNKLPDFGNSPCAWTPADPDGRNEEWIKVGFEEGLPLKQVAIAENFNPGAIVRVYAYDESGKEFLIYDAPATQLAVKGRMLRIFPKQQNLVANAVKIVMQPSKVSGFSQVDAIAISDAVKPVEAVINIAKGPLLKTQRENMGPAINSMGQEVAPIISPDGKTLFFTRGNFAGNVGTPETQDIWYSKLNDKNIWEPAVNMGPPINNHVDNAVTSISADGKTIYVINVYRPDGSMELGLSRSFQTKTGWTFPKEYKINNLRESIRNDSRQKQVESMETTVSPYGNVMILSVERSDTEGKKDLYVSFLQSNDSWSSRLVRNKSPSP